MRLAVVLAIPLLAGSIDTTRPVQPERLFKLRLGGIRTTSGVFFSAWNAGDVIAAHDGSDGKPVTYVRKFYWTDGCQWEAHEQLTPEAPARYAYVYEEAPVRCPKDAVADPSVRRTGQVTVEPTDKGPITPLVAWTPGWDKPR